MPIGSEEPLAAVGGGVRGARLAWLWVLAVATALVLPIAVPRAAPGLAQQDPCVGASPAPFTDREAVAEVHRPAVDCLWHLGIVRGVPAPGGGVRFLPHVEVQRDQFAGMLHATLEAAGRADDLPEPHRPRFADVPEGHPFDDQVHALAAAGVIDGTATDRFSPDRTLRRDETAALLVRTVAWATGDDLVASSGPHFADTGGSVLAPPVDVAFEYRLADGVRRPCADRLGTYRPALGMQRQQAASVLVNAITVLDTVSAGEGGGRGPDASCPAPVWHPDLAEAVAFAEGRTGSVSFAAIGTDGRMVGHRASTRVPMASVLKVMFLAAYLRDPDVRDRELTSADRDLLEPMIRRSANEPATTIADRLGPAPMYALADEAGMQEFSYTRPWGRSTTSARDQARFLLELDRYVPERHRPYVLRLLTEIIPEQRWGIGEVATEGWTKHFKGGWGAGTGAVDHQVVLLRHGDGTRIALAVMTTGSPSHEYGTNTLRGIFGRLLEDLP